MVGKNESDDGITEKEMVEILVDISVASEASISYSYLRDAPIEEVIIIKSKMNDILKKRKAEADRARMK